MTDLATSSKPLTDSNTSLPSNNLPISNPKSRRARPRRRAAESTNGSDDEGGSETDRGSLTDASSVPEDEDTDSEVEEDTPAPVVDTKAKSSSSTPPKAVASVFSDTTPMVWADQVVDEKVEEVTFEEFATGGGRGRGKGGSKGVPREKKELTEEAKKRLAEKKEKKKEKLKAKRKAEKEAKAVAKKTAASTAKAGKSEVVEKAEKEDKVEEDGGWGEGAPSKVVAEGGKVDKATKDEPEDGGWGEGAESRIIATGGPAATGPSASHIPAQRPPKPSGSLTHRPPAHDQSSRPNNREVYLDKLANDPKFVPRPGGFPNNDQRQYGTGEFRGGHAGFRGMNGNFRGQQQFRGDMRGGRGFRGRGRGFGPGNGFMRLPEQEQEGPKVKDGRLEMDKLEDEENARIERVELAKKAAEEVKASQSEPEQTGEKVEAVPVKSGGGKWGHEGFEQNAHFERSGPPFRGNFRGGRGFGMGRGGLPQFGPPTFHQQNRPHFAPRHLPPARSQAISAEQHNIPPTIENLLPADDTVTVHLPGSKQSVIVPAKPPVKPQSNDSTPSLPQQSIDSAPPPPRAQPTQTNSSQRTPHPIQNPPNPAPSPLPMHLTGGSNRSQYHPSSPFRPTSQNGSDSSSGFVVPPPSSLPPGIGVGANGEYYNLANGAPVDYFPAPGHPNNGGRPYHPQQNHQSQYYPRRPTPPVNDFSPNFTTNPYQSAPDQMPFFVPPAPARRVSIRNPSIPNDETEIPKVTKSKLGTNGNTFVPQMRSASQSQLQDDQQYYQQAYNPYAVQEGAGMGYTYWQGQGQGQGYSQGYAYQDPYGY